MSMNFSIFCLHIHNYFLPVQKASEEFLCLLEKVRTWLCGFQFLLQGETDIEQLAMVISSLGTPTESSWPGLTSLPDYNKITFPESRAIPWETLIPDCPPDALSLMQCFLLYDAEKRTSAEEVNFQMRWKCWGIPVLKEFQRPCFCWRKYQILLLLFLLQALTHPYFFTPPLPCPLTDMPKPHDGHRNKFRGKAKAMSPSSSPFQLAGNFHLNHLRYNSVNRQGNKSEHSCRRFI